jgi:hypothetical protein
VLWVEGAIRGCLTTRKATAATADTVNEWTDFYKDELDFRRIVLEACQRAPVSNGHNLGQPDGQPPSAAW